MSGTFTPRNPSKYMGNPHKITYRSSWEAKVMTYLDNNSAILAWASEELIVPYVSPIDNQIHRYFPDFLIKVQDKAGKMKVLMIEVKPFKQTIEPKIPKRVTKQYIAEVATYAINQAKWKAAIDYCQDRKWEFQVWHEAHLGISYLNKSKSKTN